MTFGEHVYLYCERGTHPELWAEPINAISNAGFFLAALIFWQLVLWRPRAERSADHYLLIALTFLIAFGSLAFHVYADKGTALADVVPIGLFMLVYLGIALNRFLAVPPGWTVLLVAGFAALAAGAGAVQCWDGGIGFPGPDVAGAKPCLNGSVGYLPALAALIVVGMVLAERNHRAAPFILWAAVVFTVSIILRSVDLAFCDRVVIDGRPVGTHFIWHLLNAVVLFLLLRASLENGSTVAAEAEPEPLAVPAPAPAPAPVEAVPAKNEIKETPEVASVGEEAAVKSAAPEPEDAAPEPVEDTAAAPKAVEAETEPDSPAEEAAAPDAPEGASAGEDDAVEEDAPKKGRAKKKPSFPA